MKDFLKKYREIITYLVFGVITTAVSMGVYFAILMLAEHLGGISPSSPEFNGVRLVAQVLQWIAGVLVAFFTNKKWVFKNEEKGMSGTGVQLVKFAGARVMTYFLEVGVNLGAIALLDACGYNAPTLTLFSISIVLSSRLWAKVISSVLVVISNYFISKLLVFVKK
jgi:putative flippase GtrA